MALDLFIFHRTVFSFCIVYLCTANFIMQGFKTLFAKTLFSYSTFSSALGIVVVKCSTLNAQFCNVFIRFLLEHLFCLFFAKIIAYFCLLPFLQLFVFSPTTYLSFDNPLLKVCTALLRPTWSSTGTFTTISALNRCPKKTVATHCMCVATTGCHCHYHVHHCTH